MHRLPPARRVYLWHTLVVSLLTIVSLGRARPARAQETLTSLSPINASTTTGEKPQSKLWFHAGHWWAVMPSSSAKPSGTWLWRLDADHTWKNMLRLGSSTSAKADAKSFGDVTHVLLHQSSGQLVSIEYVPGLETYALWSVRPTTTNVSLSGAETATIDVDTTARMWLSADDGSRVIAYYSDYPYTAFQGPLTLANNIHSDDITLVVALPLPLPSKVGVFFSNQVTKHFGFRTHLDGDPPATWSADELPASQSELNVAGGMADDHFNGAVASDGTLYVSAKTSYNKSNLPTMALLVRRPNGVWDNLYTVENGTGTRPIVVLNEVLGFVRVLYSADTGGGNIYYRDSPLFPIGFGARKTALSGSLNNCTSTKDNWTDELVVMASSRSVLFRVPALLSSTTTIPTTSTSSTSSTSSTTTSAPAPSSTTTTSAPAPSSSTITTSSTAPSTSSSTTSSLPLPTTTTSTLPPGTTVTSTYQAGVSGPAGTADVDTNVRLSAPTTTYGTDSSLVVGVTNGADKVYRTIIAFRMADVPAGATITSCRVTLNVNQRTSPTPGHIRRLCGEHWLDGNGASETQSTWASWNTGAAWGVAGAGSTSACAAGGDYTAAGEVAYTPPAGTGFFTFPDVAALCQDALDQRGGWLRLRISQDAEGAQSNLLKFDSSEASTPANRPKLTVTWAAPTP